LADGLPYGPCGPGHRHGIFRTESGGLNRVYLFSREVCRETLRAAVGRQMHGPATFDQSMAQGLGRKKVATRATCAKENSPLLQVSQPTPPRRRHWRG